MGAIEGTGGSGEKLEGFHEELIADTAMLMETGIYDKISRTLAEGKEDPEVLARRQIYTHLGTMIDNRGLPDSAVSVFYRNPGESDFHSLVLSLREGSKLMSGEDRVTPEEADRMRQVAMRRPVPPSFVLERVLKEKIPPQQVKK